MTSRVDAAKARIAEIEAELKKAKEQAAALAIKARAQQKKTERQLNERRKYLLGAYFLDRISREPELKSEIVAGLDKYLTRNSDREKFDLPAIDEGPKQREAAPSQPQQTATAEKQLTNNSVR